MPGTFIAIDIGIQELQSEWRVCDIYGALYKMRKERSGSIQTFVQYLYVHQVRNAKGRVDTVENRKALSYDCSKL